MEPEKLYVTIHPEDTGAYKIWNEDIGLEESRIIRIEGNFWDIGEGPSGPNTEIFYESLWSKRSRRRDVSRRRKRKIFRSMEFSI